MNTIAMNKNKLFSIAGGIRKVRWLTGIGGPILRTSGNVAKIDPAIHIFNPGEA